MGGRVLTILRDDRPDIPCPNMWDLVGGGADPGEDPWTCLCREAAEEVALNLSEAELLWQRRYPAVHSEGWVMFYVLRLPAAAEAGIVLGDEGQRWRLMEPPAFAALPDAVPSLQSRLRDWLATR